MFHLNCLVLEDTLDERMRIARNVLRVGNPEIFLAEAEKLDTYNQNLLFGYVRSFLHLAYCGDVQIAADSLGTTRQSVKRHIVELENLLEVKLFNRIGASSKLTSMGTMWLPKAQEMRDVAAGFFLRKGREEARYQSTQLPLRMLLHDQSNSQLLRSFAQMWMQGDKSI